MKPWVGYSVLPIWPDGGHQTRTSVQSLSGDTSMTGMSAIMRWRTQLACVTRICRSESQARNDGYVAIGQARCAPEDKNAADGRSAGPSVSAVRLRPPVRGRTTQVYARQRSGKGDTFHRGADVDAMSNSIPAVVACAPRVR